MAAQGMRLVRIYIIITLAVALSEYITSCLRSTLAATVTSQYRILFSAVATGRPRRPEAIVYHTPVAFINHAGHVSRIKYNIIIVITIMGRRSFLLLARPASSSLHNNNNNNMIITTR